MKSISDFLEAKFMISIQIIKHDAQKFSSIFQKRIFILLIQILFCSIKITKKIDYISEGLKTGLPLMIVMFDLAALIGIINPLIILLPVFIFFAIQGFLFLFAAIGLFSLIWTDSFRGITVKLVNNDGVEFRRPKY